MTAIRKPKLEYKLFLVINSQDTKKLKNCMCPAFKIPQTKTEPQMKIILSLEVGYKYLKLN